MTSVVQSMRERERLDGLERDVRDHDVRARQADRPGATSAHVERRRRSRRRSRASPRSTAPRRRPRSPGRSRAAPPRPRARRSRSRRRGATAARAPAALRGRAASSGASRSRTRAPDRPRPRARRPAGASQGGPTQRRPTRTGRWKARHLSSHPPRRRRSRTPPKNAHMRSSPAASVYAASSTPVRAVDLLEALGEELDHGRARLLGARRAPTSIATRRSELSGTRSSASRRSSRRAGRCARR